MNYTDVTVADIDGDGKGDIVGGGERGNFAVLRGNGDVTFDAPELWHCANVSDLVAGDFSRDGIADVVVLGRGLQFIPGTGGGAFDTYRSALPAGAVPYSSWLDAHVSQPAAADMNGDGAPDVVALTAEDQFDEIDIVRGDAQCQ